MSPQFSENLLAEVYVETDELLKAFQCRSAQSALGPFLSARRKPRLRASEVATILVGYHVSGYKCFEYYYREHAKNLPQLFCRGALLQRLCLLYHPGIAAACFAADVQMRPGFAHGLLLR